MTDTPAPTTVADWDVAWLSILPEISTAQLRQYVAMRLWKDLVEQTKSNVFANYSLPTPQVYATTVATVSSQPPLRLLCNLATGSTENEEQAESRALQSQCIQTLADIYQLEVVAKPELAHTDLDLSPHFWRQWQAIVLANPKTDDKATGDAIIGCAEPYSIGLWIDRLQQPAQLKLIEPWTLHRFLATKHAIGVHTGYRANQMLDLAQAPALHEVDLGQQQDEQSIVNLCHSLFADVIAKGASDLHLDNQPSGLIVAMRQDGILHEQFRLNPQSGQLLASRVKLLAGLDITEQRRPQDGRISLLHASQRQEIRISVMPTVQGEKIVLRFFDPALLTRSLAEMGMPDKTFEGWKTLLSHKSGLLLTVGPTGSGKTSTLYSSIRYLSDQSIHICTVEDPVEIIDTRINQVQVDHHLGMDFGKILKHLLRQDPDVIMIGEIRDEETAQIAVQAALTGHLVLASLHTRDALGTILRLRELGVPYNLCSTIGGIMAQRLVRCICRDCTPDSRSACITCSGSGYSGRRAIFELLMVDENLIDTIEHRSLAEVKTLLETSKHLNLWQEGMALVEQGITNLEEIERVCPQSEQPNP